MCSPAGSLGPECSGVLRTTQPATPSTRGSSVCGLVRTRGRLAECNLCQNAKPDSFFDREGLRAGKNAVMRATADADEVWQRDPEFTEGVAASTAQQPEGPRRPRSPPNHLAAV